MQETEKLSKSDLSKYGEDIQALLINLMGDPFCPNSVKLKRLNELDINKKLMRNGIAFIWSEIEILQDLMKIMEKKNFKYIEHFTIVHLSLQKAVEHLDANERKTYQNIFKEEQKSKISAKFDDGSDDFNETESSDLSNPQKELTSYDFLLNKLCLKKNLKAFDMFFNEEQEDYFFKRSKRVLLMFRRVNSNLYIILIYLKFDVKNCQLELRHQRTCDVLFDLVDENGHVLGKSLFFLSLLMSLYLEDMKKKEYIYKMIETLLPKANLNIQENPKKVQLKMMEMFHK